MRVSVVLGLCFFPHQAKRLARVNVSEMTDIAYSMSSGGVKQQLNRSTWLAKDLTRSAETEASSCTALCISRTRQPVGRGGALGAYAPPNK